MRGVKKRFKDLFFLAAFMGALLSADPTYTRLFFFPTAYTLPKGAGYFSVHQVLFPSLTVGLTGFLDLTGGVSLVPGLEDQFFYVSPKMKFFHQGKFAMAGGILYANTIRGGGIGGGFIYGVFTVGGRNSSFSIGLAWPFLETELAQRGIIAIGGTLPVGRSLKFISENYIFPGGSSLLSAGLRFYTSKLSVDFALMYPTGEHDGLPFVPWLGFSYRFNF